MSGKATIPDELADFLGSGLSITVGTRDSELQPDLAVAWAALVNDDRSRLTVFLHQEAARAMLRNLKVCPEVALAFDRPTSHRACQVKGLYVSTRRARASERRDVERQVNSFFVDLEAIGIPRTMVAEWDIWPCSVIEMRVTELFEQTPGPGTGEPFR